MKKFIILTSLLALTSCGASDKNDSSDNTQPIERNKDVTVNQLQQLLKSDTTVFVLDVRTFPEYTEAHIKEVDVRFSFDSLSFNMDKIPSDKMSEIFCYCRSGRRSEIVSNQLRKLGYSNVHNVLGGMIAWQNAGFEVAKGKY